MRCMITGVTGFIGSHLARKILARDHEVFGLSYSMNTERISDILNHDNFHVGVCDLRDAKSLKNHRDIDCVLHMASILPTTGMARPQYMFDVNVGGTLNTLLYSRKAKIKKFIHASSMSVYSTPPKTTFLKEDAPTNPTDLYGKTKELSEKMVLYHGDAYKHMDVAVLRYGGVYGGGDER